MDTSATRMTIGFSGFAQCRECATFGPVLKYSAHVSAVGNAVGLVVLLGSNRTRLPFLQCVGIPQIGPAYGSNVQKMAMKRSGEVTSCIELKPRFVLKKHIWQPFLMLL